MTRVALAYSGSLDTTICAHWLKDIKGLEVYTFSANLGQLEYLEPLAEQAVQLGAVAAHIADLRERFAEDYIFPCIRAQAKYEDGYFLFSALSRPLIIEELVQIARDEGCEWIAHGSRGIGNDRLRIENCLKTLAPDLQVLAPLEELGLKNAQEDLEYAKQHHISFESLRETLYNVEENIWGANIQVHGLSLWEEPPENTYLLTVPLAQAPSRPLTLEIAFEKGVPTELNGEALSAEKLITRLNKVGGRYAIGRYDVVENRISGLKTRELYESPAATILYKAHRALERATLDKDTLHFKESPSQRLAELIYEGKWFTPLCRGLNQFFQQMNENVTGTVRVNLQKGRAAVSGVKSPHALL